MSCAHTPCMKPPHSCTCRRPSCAKKRGRAKSKPLNRASDGCSLKVTLSLTWNGSTLDTGKRR